MQNKNIYYYIVLGVVVVLGVASYFIPFDLFKTKLSEKSPKTENTSIAPSTPKFVMGVVSGVDGQKILIKIAEEEKTLRIDDKTMIVKQIKEGGKFNNIPAGIIEISNSSRVVVYYTEEPSSPEYRAVKIQILNF